VDSGSFSCRVCPAVHTIDPSAVFPEEIICENLTGETYFGRLCLGKGEDMIPNAMPQVPICDLFDSSSLSCLALCDAFIKGDILCKNPFSSFSTLIYLNLGCVHPHLHFVCAAAATHSLYPQVCANQSDFAPLSTNLLIQTHFLNSPAVANTQSPPTTPYRL